MMKRETTQPAEENGVLRPAIMRDAEGIHDLITYYAERNKMLFRSLEEIYEDIREFRVFVDANEKVIGCCSLSILWKDLAEVRSLCVAPNSIGFGIGKQLVLDTIVEAKKLGLKQLFALTYESPFFIKLGFRVVDKELLPHKVWTDCIKCELQNQCNEIPVLMNL
jgi:amino-acid N-acetyltransferase